MNFQFQANAHPASTNADCVVVGVYKGNELSQAAAQLDTASSGAITSHLELGDFSGEKNRASMLYQLAGVAAKRVLLVGLGERDKLTVDTLTQATYCAAANLKATKVSQVISFLTDEATQDGAEAAVRQSITAVADTFYSFNDFKSNKEEIPTPQLAHWTLAQQANTDLAQATRQGIAIAEGMKLCRDLANSPGNVCTPTYLAKAALKLGHSQANLEVEVLEETHMAELGMGSFLSVSKGSEEPGKMIILQYKGGQEGAAPVVLVGKGITFDTGGISLKPGAAMDEMKFDMTGAASVLGTLAACVSMQLPLNVIGVLAAAENMPSGKASKPGDIVTSMAGKTIEILNTDAEGRLVLCDALTYVERFTPSAVIDIATLTGACITALGHHTSGLLSNNDDLANEVLAAGKQANDEAWRLPMGEKYQDQLKSNFADMANIGGPPAGTITAACFLARFTESYPWVHLDIAGTAWKSGAAKGSTGRPVPLLCQWLINRAQ